MTANARTLEIRGHYVVLLILALTAAVGSLFIFLGPRATAKSPGILHAGLRYADEGTVDFLRFGKNGPPARLLLIDSDGRVQLEANDLQLGRNLIPIENLPAGPYRARVEATGYATVEIPVLIEGRLLRPVPGTTFEPGTLADNNMIGVRFKPAAPASLP